MRSLRLLLTSIIVVIALLLVGLWTDSLKETASQEELAAKPATPSSTEPRPVIDKLPPVTGSPAIDTNPIATDTMQATLPQNSREPLVTKELDAFDKTNTLVLSATPIITESSDAETPEPTETPHPTVAPDLNDRTCPDPSPLKPEYLRYYLSGGSWPKPDPELVSHFWLSMPFYGGERLLITEWFPYGYDVGGRYLIHNGIDMAEPLGTPILAVAEGTVVVAGDDASVLYGWRCDWYGHLVVLELDDRWGREPVYILYGHVQNISVEPGQRVSRGESLAEVGLGGAASLPHLHLEVRVGDNVFSSTRNPLLWLVPSSRRGVIAGRLLDPLGRPWQGVLVSAVGRTEGTSDHLTWTYLGDPQLLVNPDETFAENFVIGDLEPGRYTLFVTLQSVTYSVDVDVEPGKLSVSEIITEPYKTPTPVVPQE